MYLRYKDVQIRFDEEKELFGCELFGSLTLSNKSLKELKKEIDKKIKSNFDRQKVFVFSDPDIYVGEATSMTIDGDVWVTSDRYGREKLNDRGWGKKIYVYDEHNEAHLERVIVNNKKIKELKDLNDFLIKQCVKLKNPHKGKKEDGEA